MFSAIFFSMRPRQWSKNLILFAGLIFSNNLTNLTFLLKSFAAFIIFCLLSSSVYIINDIVDREQDRKHPTKSKRPIAAGRLPINYAIISALFLIIAGLVSALFIKPELLLISMLYFLLMIGYSFIFKKMVVLDVLIVALGFTIRAWAGTVVIGVEISVWLFVCTILLALFLALSKRRHELVFLEDGAVSHRSVLGKYSTHLLDQMISVVTASTVVAYAIYTIAPETVGKFHTKNLVLTVPFVLYGIFRYLYLVYQKKLGGSPERVLLEDKALILNIGLWFLSIIVIIYIL